MRMRLLFLLAIMMFLGVACQGPVRTEVVIVVTATSDSSTDAPPTDESSVSDQTQEPDITTTPAPSPTPDPFPTPIVRMVWVAEQRFEGGRMFWLEPINQIIVLINDTDSEGQWLVFDDTFDEGDVESDPTLEAPEGLYQPVRGFGKLWRENPEVKEALGWALEDERGHTTSYEYHHGGTVEDDTYISGPGYHLITSLFGDVYQLNEGLPNEVRHWEKIQ